MYFDDGTDPYKEEMSRLQVFHFQPGGSVTSGGGDVVVDVLSSLLIFGTAMAISLQEK